MGLCSNRKRRMKSLSSFDCHHVIPDFFHCGNQKESFPGHSFACNVCEWQLKVCSHNTNVHMKIRFNLKKQQMIGMKMQIPCRWRLWKIKNTPVTLVHLKL